MAGTSWMRWRWRRPEHMKRSRLQEMVDLDTTAFLVITVAAALAALAATVLPRWMAPPVVVLELVFGILIGPEVFGFVEPSKFTDFFSNLGLGMLFFFAGYEIDFARIKGEPMKLAG